MLLYDSFSLRHLRVEVLFYPPSEDRFPEGVLSRLYASLNHDDMFDDCALRQRLGAIFEGERLTFDIETRRIRMHFRDFGTIQEVKENLHHLLTDTKKTLREAGMRYLLLTDEVEMWGLVPPEKDTVDVAASLRSKAMKVTQPHLDKLPGQVISAGLQVHGHAPDDDNYTYDVTIAPYGHRPKGGSLYLDAELNFGFPPEPPEDDIADVVEAVQTTYDFINRDLIDFAKSLMP